MKIDNIFRRTVDDKIFGDQYNVPFGKYKTIADGLNSNDGHVKMLATILKAIDKKVEEQKMEQRLRNQDASVSLLDSDMASLYKKMIKQLQTEI